MRRSRTSQTALLMTLIFLLSFLALTFAPHNHDLLPRNSKIHVEEAAAFSAISVFIENTQHASILLNQTTRMDIYNFVTANPGIHFRALADLLNQPIGVLQYHLGLLVNGGLLSSHRDGRYKRYFESKKFTEVETKVISALRHTTSGRILVTLVKEPQMTHKDLAARLHISSQALSWQMTRLEKMGLITRSSEGLRVKYSLEETVGATVSRYATLLDNIATSIRADS